MVSVRGGVDKKEKKKEGEKVPQNIYILNERMRFNLHCRFNENGIQIQKFTASAFRKLPSIYVFSYFPFGFEGRIWDLIVSVTDHCLSFYLNSLLITTSETI